MRSHRVIALVVATAVLGLYAVGPTANAKEDELAPKHMLKSFANGAPDQGDSGDQGAKGDAGPKTKPTANNGISYHGGPIILNTTNAYLIWYGNWAGNSATTIL